MPTTVRLHRIIVPTLQTVDRAVLELKGTPAPFEEADLPGALRLERDDHANVGRTVTSSILWPVNVREK
jgi:hypothetical protein